jgi:predicted ATPase
VVRLKILKATRYRSLADLQFYVRNLNLLIGSNGSGKSNVLDALRFLSEAVRERDFTGPIYSRGNLIQLAWKGEEARDLELETVFEEDDHQLSWRVRIARDQRDFTIEEEEIYLTRKGAPREELLRASGGQGKWYSERGYVPLSIEQTGCALAAAASDQSFPGRIVAEFVKTWGFFDPSPGYLRLASAAREEADRLDIFGRNLAGRLYETKQSRPDVFKRIIDAVRGVLGMPDDLEPRLSDDGSVYFVVREAGMKFAIHQKGVSAGTLRALALMTALLGEPEASLIGIEEPENYIHPNALEALGQYFEQASQSAQVLITTHSPLLLNFIGDPEAVCLVHRTPKGTQIERESNAGAVSKALDESGFGLGDFHETKGFGS